jgi:hypothetical protein
MSDKVFNLIKPQANFISCRARYPAYVAAWGTGKSMSLIAKGMMESEQHNGNLGVIFRKEFTDLRDSTVRDFEEYTGLKVNSERCATLGNGSQILFRHMEEMNNLQNMNLGWFAIEQAEELDTDEQFFKLHGRLRREGVHRTGFIIANTNGHNWIYRLWKAQRSADYPLFEADSFAAAKYLPADTIASWRELEQKKPKIYRRFVLNSWDESDTVDVVISPEFVEAATRRQIDLRRVSHRLVTIDVARYGDDKIVFYALEGDGDKIRVVAKEKHEKKSTMETVGLALIFAKKHGGEDQSYAVDEIGVGAGVVDRLEELGKHVISVNAAERANVRQGCYNRRAEIHVNGAELLEKGKVQLLADDEAGREQLSWTRYKTVKSSGIFQVEAKDDVKARYGVSPDDADSLLNGLWAMPQAKRIKGRDGYADDSRSDQTAGVEILG